MDQDRTTASKPFMAEADAFMLVGDPIPPTIQNMVVRSEVHGGFDEQAPRKRVEVRYTEAQGEGSRTTNPKTNIDDLEKPENKETGKRAT